MPSFYNNKIPWKKFQRLKVVNIECQSQYMDTVIQQAPIILKALHLYNVRNWITLIIDSDDIAKIMSDICHNYGNKIFDQLTCNVNLKRIHY